ncbi:MAG: hypothetical protein AAGK17_13565 [Pseudomonadota bacterium]
MNAGVTRVHVMGVIHGRHRTSERYSLDVLRKAVWAAKPDVILSEIPPDRIDQAVTSFRDTGSIDEPRTQVFPEYTDVVFPLSREMDFRILGTAGWTREIADNRRAALERIQGDPTRSEQWAEHRAALRRYSRDVAGRGDDPFFIHTPEFDRLVEASRTPYQQYFDEDLGPGGWTQINAAHTNLINSALDLVGGQGKTALIMFGNAHKYMILRSLERRTDIDLLDTRALFA